MQPYIRILCEASGLNVVTQLSADPVTAGIPIIIVTSKLLSAKDRKQLSGYVESILSKTDFSYETMMIEVRRVNQTYNHYVS